MSVLSRLRWPFVVSLTFFVVGCWNKVNTSEKSEIDAISAASKRLFSKNVRGYMWALTTDSPALFAQAPSSIATSTSAARTADARAYDPFADVSVSASDSSSSMPSIRAGSIPVARLDPLNSPLYQCWYYAETPAFVRLDGAGLKALFVDKSKTKKVNNNFIDVRNLGAVLEKSETFRQFESFALSALPGTCFLFSSLGPLKGSAKGALTNALCSISLGSLSSLRKGSGDGWGSDKARVQIQNQMRARAEELEEVNWDVLSTLKNEVARFNLSARFEETTQVQCPANEMWVAELMGATR